MDTRPVQLWVPHDIKSRLEAQAKLNGTSQKSQVIRALWALMARGMRKMAAE